MALAALIVSVVSACAALAAIVVTLKIHDDQGSKLKCQWSYSYPLYGGDLGDGRAATTVEAWGFAIFDQGRDTNATLVDFHPPPWQPSLPTRIDSESSATWMMSVSDIAQSLTSSPYPDGAIFLRS